MTVYLIVAAMACGEIWFLLRWTLATLLLCGIIKLIERDAPEETIRLIAKLNDNLGIDYEDRYLG